MSYRYKRYKKRGGSTGVIKMRFQSFMDISTTDTSMQVITVSAGGANILQRLGPQFAAYKYYKIGSVSVKLVPASTLPVDPTGLSIAPGDTTVDPRDQLTPGLMRITNGEDVLENITGMSDTVQHEIYNSMLLDPRWFKWMLQTGVKRYATPRFWQVGQLHQDKWPGAITNLPMRQTGVNQIEGTARKFQITDAGNGSPTELTPGYLTGSSPYGFFQVGHSGRLGWMPTDGLQPVAGLPDTPLMAAPPEVEVMKIILPKAYKTRYWYRMFITETVLFREPIVTLGAGQYRPLDVFHWQNLPLPASPTTPNVQILPTDRYTGGNYGDD